MKHLKFRLAALFLFFAVIAIPVHAYTATGNLPLQTEPSGATWDTVVADATAQSTGAASGGTPIYHSTQLEETTFIGDFKADVNTTKLAIFSDDGCDVFVDGTKIWSAKDAHQALPDLSQSLHVLPIALIPGQTYHIEVDYSNVIYTGDGDVDGVTLFTWSDPLNVTVDLSGVDSVTLTAGVKGSGPIKATVSNAPQSTATCQVTSVTWDWNFGDVQYSKDGETNWAGAPDGIGYDMTIDDGSSQNTNFNMILDSGYWQVALTATVTYHTTCGDISGSDWNYVGQTYTMALQEEILQPRSLFHTASYGRSLLRLSHILRPIPKPKKRINAAGGITLLFSRIGFNGANKVVAPNKTVSARIGVGVNDIVDFTAALPIGKLDPAKCVWSGYNNYLEFSEVHATNANKRVCFTQAGTHKVSVTYGGLTRTATITVVPVPTHDEIWFIKTYGPAVAIRLSILRDNGINWAKSVYPEGQHNNQGDAAKHTCFNALAAIEYDAQTVADAGIAHEASTWESPGTHNETVMDIENNASGRTIGINIGGAGLGNSDVFQPLVHTEILNDINNGHLIMLDDINNVSELGLLIPTHVSGLLANAPTAMLKNNKFALIAPNSKLHASHKLLFLPRRSNPELSADRLSACIDERVAPSSLFSVRASEQSHLCIPAIYGCEIDASNLLKNHSLFKFADLADKDLSLLPAFSVLDSSTLGQNLTLFLKTHTKAKSLSFGFDHTSDYVNEKSGNQFLYENIDNSLFHTITYRFVDYKIVAIDAEGMIPQGNYHSEAKGVLAGLFARYQKPDSVSLVKVGEGKAAFAAPVLFWSYQNGAVAAKFVTPKSIKESSVKLRPRTSIEIKLVEGKGLKLSDLFFVEQNTPKKNTELTWLQDEVNFRFNKDIRHIENRILINYAKEVCQINEVNKIKMALLQR